MPDKELKTDRLLLLLGFLIFYAWGFIYQLIMPFAKDPSMERIFACGLILALLVCSYFIEFVKKNLSYFIYGLAYILTLHQAWLVSLNGITAEFLLLYVVMILIFKTYFKHIIQLIAYSIYSLLLIGITFKLTPVSQIDPIFAYSNLLSIDLLIVPILVRRLVVQHKLDYNQALMKSLYIESTDSLFLLNEDLTVKDFNTCAKEKFIRSTEWKDKTIGEFLPNSVEEKIKEKVTIHSTSKLAWHDEFETQIDEKPFWGDITYKSIQAPGENLWFLRIADITVHKQTEMQLQNRTKALQRSNVDLEQMAYVASHDLQEPLRTISSFVQLLEKRFEKILDNEAQEFIGYVVEGTERMKHLINDLLTYSRIDVVGGEPVPIDIAKVINQILKNVVKLINDSEAEIHIDGEFPVIYGVSFEMTELFQNLISNALKFKSKERKTVLSISSSKIYNADPSLPAIWLFKIADNGIGISEEYHQKIFLIFQRLHSRDQYPGTGIGLSICKKIVEKYNGKIWVESELDKGTIFSFTLCENAFKLKPSTQS